MQVREHFDHVARQLELPLPVLTALGSRFLQTAGLLHPRWIFSLSSVTT
jgi:hypothetical protein